MTNRINTEKRELWVSSRLELKKKIKTGLIDMLSGK